MSAASLDEAKKYLRVDHSEEDGLIESLLAAAEQMCMDAARIKSRAGFVSLPVSKPAVLYAAAYLYEHREEADHGALMLTLRAMLSGVRKAAF